MLWDNPFILAPMAGVTDLPFRRLCKRLGAGMVVSEMVHADPKFRHSDKTQRRLQHHPECAPRAVQIAGADASMMAEFAAYNADQGADIIDINLGCPAKKVRRQAAGSALLEHESLVAEIFAAVVAAVPIPVTAKIRTGPHPGWRNGVRIAQIAESAGIQAIAVHGRTRACAFKGPVEYRTIKEIKAAVSIPVIANGDITDPAQAVAVLKDTGADAVMIGRGAQGKPWIFDECLHFQATGELPPPPALKQIGQWLGEHLEALYALYGEQQGCQVAKKHLNWYAKAHPESGLRAALRELNTSQTQMRAMRAYFQ